MVCYPDYLDEYACKRDACRRTCCSPRDWDIFLSRGEYEHALAAAGDDPELAALLGNFEVPATGRPAGGAADDPGSAEREYAAPKSGDGGLCAFLTVDRACAWRAACGHDLCSICHEFPRDWLRVFDVDYVCPSGACEAVLEAILAKDGPIELRTRETIAESGEAPVAYQFMVTDDNAARDSVYGHYDRLARLGLDVLQDGRRSLDERMVILLACLAMTDQLAGLGQTSRLEMTLASMLDERRVGVLLHSAFSACGPNPALKICGEMYLACLRSPAFSPTAQAVLDGLGLAVVRRNPYAAPELRLADPGRIDERKALLADWLREREPFLARVMASVYLHGMVPIANPGAWACSRYFALTYALVKLAILGRFGHAPTDGELVDLLVVVLRAFTHNAGFYRKALAYMDDLGVRDLPTTLRLVVW